MSVTEISKRYIKELFFFFQIRAMSELDNRQRTSMAKNPNLSFVHKGGFCTFHCKGCFDFCQTNLVSDPGRQSLCLLCSAQKDLRKKEKGQEEEEEKYIFGMKMQSCLKLQYTDTAFFYFILYIRLPTQGFNQKHIFY